MKKRYSVLDLSHSIKLAALSLALATFSHVLAFADTTIAAKLVPALVINGPLNSLQQIQYSTNLTDPNAWTVLSYVRLDTPQKSFYDDSANGEKRFYRTKMVGTADTNLVWIPPGTFLMGSPTNEVGRGVNEGPQTLVTLTKGFLMGRFEVKNVEWLVYSNTLPIDYGSSNVNALALRGIGWDWATNYCALRTLDELQRGIIPAGWYYRLPTEAEWEYACRAGNSTPFGIGNGLELRSDALRQDATFDGRFPYPTNLAPTSPIGFSDTTPIGSYPPNGFGLYDMHGNVGELTWDFLGANLPGGSVTNLMGGLVNNLVGGANQFARGGNFNDQAFNCRSAVRKFPVPFARTGFRVVLIPSDDL